jgi:hypothetical protein
VFGWVRKTIGDTTYSHIEQPQDMSCGATSIAMLVWNCSYGLGSEIAARWTMRGVERERMGRTVLSDPDPMDDTGTDEARVEEALKNFYGLTATTVNSGHFQTLMSSSPKDWTSFVVGVFWVGGGGHLITIIVRGANALIFDPGETSGTIKVVSCATLVTGVAPNYSLNVPGMAAHWIDRAVHVPPQRSGLAIFKNLAQTPSWLWHYGRTGFRM